MSETKLFKNCVFISLPKTANKSVTQFKNQIYMANGAVCKQTLTPRNATTITHILVDFEVLKNKHSIVRQLNFGKIFHDKLNSNKKEFRELTEKIASVPVVKDTWASNCIERSTLLNYKPYEVLIDYEIKEEYKEVVGMAEEKSSPRKRKNGLITPEVSPRKKKKQQQVEAGEEAAVTATEEASGKINSSSWIETVLNEKLLTLEKLRHNPNLPVIKALSDLRNEYNDLGDDFRVKGYDTAINALLLSVDRAITTSKAALKLQGVGPSILKKIEEFYKTGMIVALEDMRANEDVQILKKLNRIYGVGPKISKYWYDKCNIRSVEDVKANEHNLKLTESQKFGLQYYDDWLLNISRNVSQMHFDIMKCVCHSIDEKLEVYIMGSYRRGLVYSHDIDYIITRPGFTTEELKESQLSQKIMEKLKQIGYIKCILSASNSKYLTGASLVNYGDIKESEEFQKEKNICRRVDILYVPWSEIGAALMYFTGNNIFNRMIRQLASNKGYSLSNHGLYKKGHRLHRKSLQTNTKEKLLKVKDDALAGYILPAGQNGSDVEEIEGQVKDKYLIESFDERKIFEKLGVVWHEPTERNIGEFLRL